MKIGEMVEAVQAGNLVRLASWSDGILGLQRPEPGSEVVAAS